MLTCLCNNCSLFHSSRVTWILLGIIFMAPLLEAFFTNKIDHVINSGGDRQIGVESIFTITVLLIIKSYEICESYMLSKVLQQFQVTVRALPDVERTGPWHFWHLRWHLPTRGSARTLHCLPARLSVRPSSSWAPSAPPDRPRDQPRVWRTLRTPWPRPCATGSHWRAVQ